jgi:UDP-3-O-[3-hydroxymyristoyl] glucosamine N-acyltransferase
MAITLGELAVRFGCELRGEPDTKVTQVGTLTNAEPGAVTFLANPLYRGQLAGTRATAVILDAGSAGECPVASLISTNPYATYARVAALLHPPPSMRPGIHASAAVAPDAQVHPSAHIGPQAVVGARCMIGARAVIASQCVIEEDVVVGEDVRLHPHVVLCRQVQIGARTIVQAGAVIGGEGFGFAKQDDAWVKVPQLGAVRIGSDVEIGANTTIDRGAIGDTVIGDDVKLDNQIQIGHNVQIDDHTAIAGCTGISGSTRIGKRCMIAGAVGIVGHLTICDDVVITGFSMVSHSIAKPGVYSGGIPAEEASSWRRIIARLKRIDSLGRRVAALERASGKTQQLESEDD